MHKLNLSDQQIAHLIMSFIGEIEPVGETNTDGKRLNNLKLLLGVMDCLLDEIYWLLPYTENVEHSMHMIGDEAERWMKEKHEWLKDVFESDEDNINRAATIRALNTLSDKMGAANREIMKQAIAAVECMTSVDSISAYKEEQPLKWKMLDECSNSGVYCPVCNKKVFKINFSNTMKWKDLKYCPHCGSRVDGEVWL